MTISIQESRNEYTASAGQTVFNYTFKIFSSTDLNAYVTPAGQVASDLTDITTAYSVSGVGDDSGGEITLTVPTNYNDLVTIVSNIPSSRTTDYQNNGDFRPDVVNNDFDRIVAITKKIEDVANRTVLLQQSQQDPKPLSLPSPYAGHGVRWNGNESGLENFDLSTVSNEEIASDKVTLSHLTLLLAVNDTSAKSNQSTILKERTTGNGGGATWDYITKGVTTGIDLPNTFDIVACVGVPTLALKLRSSNELNLYQFGAVGDGVADDTGAWNAWTAYVGSKTLTIGSYLVSGVIKTYTTPTYVNTTTDNFSAGFGSLESCTLGTGNAASGLDSQRKTNGIAPVGSDNTSGGVRSMFNNEEGYRCTVNGFEALYSQVGSLVMGNSINANGYRCLYNNTTGKDNTINGYLGAFFNVAGGGNTGTGYRILYNTIGTDTGAPSFAAIDGSFLTASGYECMLENTYGKSCTATGWRCLYSSTTGDRISAYGQECFFSNVTGFNLTGMGYQAGYGGVNGNHVVTIGYQSLFSSIAPSQIATVGDYSLYNTTSGTKIAALGYEAGLANVSGSFLALTGTRAAARNTSGNYITANGYMSLEFTVAGGSNLNNSNCSGLGANTRISAANQVQLGDSATTTYAFGAVQDRSDRRDKIDILKLADIKNKDLTDRIVAFFMDVEWCTYRLNYRDSYITAEEYTDGEMEWVEKIVHTGKMQIVKVPEDTGKFETVRVQINDENGVPTWINEKREIIIVREEEREIVKRVQVEQEVVKTRVVHSENDGSKAGKRFHMGAIAQQVEEAMKKHNVDFAGLQHHAHGGGEDIYTLGYQEFIAIQGIVVQRQQSRLLSIEARLTKAGI